MPLEPIKNAVTAEVDAVLGTCAQEILLNLPIKATDIPDNAARALGAVSFKTYCEVIQRQIDIETIEGIEAREALKARLPMPTSSTGQIEVQLGVIGPRYIGMPKPQEISPAEGMAAMLQAPTITMLEDS